MSINKTVSIFVCISVIAAFLFLLPINTALVFYKENTNKIEAYLPVKEGETFHIAFTHSIHLTDVIEKYEVTADLEIKQNEIVYEHFGIGMPSNASEGEQFVYENGKYHIKNLNNIFPYINIRNGKTVSRNRLIWGEDNEHTVWFNQYFEPGAWFRMKVEKLTYWEYFRGVMIDGERE
ncbi:DUF1850 domain-containing protein [Gracilibacillus oryzae]|uniref:DUF1850 domain-containing protein n=1 Tax=Gracilibacillus oryzae TaxID=1672701 RepID=UPI001D1827C5|nr:DUF1850 domain-containing protein [Gracilibacillus oryzae]